MSNTNKKSLQTGKKISSALLFAFMLSVCLIPQVGFAAKNFAFTQVSHDRASINPKRHQKVSIRYTIEDAASVTLTLRDVNNRVVYRKVKKQPKSGADSFAWDAKTKDGLWVKPEAYTYALTAIHRQTKTTTTYDVSQTTGGEELRIKPIKINKKGVVSYTLAKNARVRLMISQQETYWPIVTLLDWVPRKKGRHKEKWNGWDADHRIKPLTETSVMPVWYAYTLPKNSIIVSYKAEDKDARKIENHGQAIKKHVNIFRKNVDKNRNRHIHAQHNPAICYNPKITMSFPEIKASKKQEIVSITKPTTIRFDIADTQTLGRAKPNPRMAVFIWVDGKVVERLFEGYVPYQWIFDPAEYGVGEHTISGSFTWREDHFAIVHNKVTVSR